MNRHTQEKESTEKRGEKASERPVGWKINRVRKQSKSETLATSSVFARSTDHSRHCCCSFAHTITTYSVFICETFMNPKNCLGNCL